MQAFYASDAHNSPSSVSTRWSIPARTHRPTYTKLLEAYAGRPSSLIPHTSNSNQNSFNVTMDPNKGHDLAKLSTCTTCEMAEDFSTFCETQIIG